MQNRQDAAELMHDMTTDGPLVSIVVPMHDSEVHVAEALESLLLQTYENMEIICVDDASSDSTPDIVDAMGSADAVGRQESRIRLIRFSENSGPGAARNAGIEAALGELLYCFDSDDICEPNLVAKAVRAFRDTDADMLCLAHMELESATGAFLPAEWSASDEFFGKPLVSWRDDPDHVFQAVQNFPWNKMLRMSYVREFGIRFQEDVRLTEDLMYSAMAILNTDKVAFLAEPLVMHRVGTGTNEMSSKDRYPTDFLKAFLWLKAYICEKGVYDQLRIGFSNWAALACIDNLFTLKTYKGYKRAFKALTSYGMDALGLYDVPIEDYFDDGCRAIVNSLRERRPRDAAEYAHLNFVIHRELCGQMQSRIVQLENQLDAE